MFPPTTGSSRGQPAQSEAQQALVLLTNLLSGRDDEETDDTEQSASNDLRDAILTLFERKGGKGRDDKKKKVWKCFKCLCSCPIKMKCSCPCTQHKYWNCPNPSEKYLKQQAERRKEREEAEAADSATDPEPVEKPTKPYLSYLQGQGSLCLMVKSVTGH